MLYNKMLKKAGRIFFLLVCLSFFSACGSEKAVFQAAESEKTTVETEKPFSPKQVDQAKEEAEIPCVNINTADAQELMTLPGIGKVRAEAILAERQRLGMFEKTEDIMRVKGIKQGIFNKISSFICVE